MFPILARPTIAASGVAGRQRRVAHRRAGAVVAWHNRRWDRDAHQATPRLGNRGSGQRRRRWCCAAAAPWPAPSGAVGGGGTGGRRRPIARPVAATAGPGRRADREIHRSTRPAAPSPRRTPPPTTTTTNSMKTRTCGRKLRRLPQRPWTISIDGMVAKPRTIDIDDLLKQVQLEERIYRHRCVEAWAMTVPWTGFPLSQLVKLAEPLGSAKYVGVPDRRGPQNDARPGQRRSTPGHTSRA